MSRILLYIEEEVKKLFQSSSILSIKNNEGIL